MATISSKEEKIDMKKDIEREILEYLDKSEKYWTDLYPFMENLSKKPEYSFNDFYKVLKELIDDGIIKAEEENSINFLNTTVKGKLATRTDFTFKLIDKGYLQLKNIRLQNENLEYKLTIRNLEEELKISSLLKNYAWLIGIAITVGTAIGKFLV